MFKKNLISLLVIFSMFLNPILQISFAEVDMQHNIIEDTELRFSNWYTGSCGNGEKTCIKNLIRYDGYYELVDFLKEWQKNVEDDVETAFWIPLFKKAGLLVTTAAGFYYVPIGTLIATLSSVLFCQTVNNVIEPVGETAGYVTKFFIRIKNKISEWIGWDSNSVRNPDRGVIGMLSSILCGDGTESDKTVTLTKEDKKKFISDILRDLKSRVEEKSYQGNDVIVLSLNLNPKKLEYKLKFDELGFNPYYEKAVDEYFKSRSYFKDEL